MQLKNLIFIILIIFSKQVYSQEIDFQSHPSNWPNPFTFTIEERIDRKYSKDRIIKYLKFKEEWRKQNLPDLFLNFEEIERVNQFLHSKLFVLEIAKEDTSVVSSDSLKMLDIKPFAWLQNSLKDQPNPCGYLEDWYYDIYVVQTGNNSLIKCVCMPMNMLENDFETEYRIGRKGDTILLKILDDR